MYLTYNLTPHAPAIMDTIGAIVHTAPGYHNRQANELNVSLQKRLLGLIIESVAYHSTVSEQVEIDLQVKSVEVVNEITKSTCASARAYMAEEIANTLMRLALRLKEFFEGIARQVLSYGVLSDIHLERAVLYVGVQR